MNKPDIDAPDRHGDGGAAARLVVDLAALAGNYRTIASSTAAEVAGVVKANGYGLGALAVAPALHAAGCRTFFTAFTSEAVELRRRPRRRGDLTCSCRSSATRRTFCSSTV